MKVLDLACGSAKAKDAIGVDVNSDSDADVICDLNVHPYPFLNDQFDKIICNHGLEHLIDVIHAIEEIHRISRHGALVRIVVPHFSSCDTYTDPTHKRAFSSRSMDYFIPDTDLSRHKYSRCCFRKRRVLITFLYFSRWLLLWKKFLQWIVNRTASTQWIYERHHSYLFPAHQLVFELEVVKGPQP